jgi:hypothetical protein
MLSILFTRSKDVPRVFMKRNCFLKDYFSAEESYEESTVGYMHAEASLYDVGRKTLSY